MTLVSTKAYISSFIYKQVASTKYLYNFVYVYSHLGYLYVYRVHADAFTSHKRELHLRNWSYRRYLSCLIGVLRIQAESSARAAAPLKHWPHKPKLKWFLIWGTRRLLGVEYLRHQTKDGKGYLQRSVWKRGGLCHTFVVWGHFQTASVENNARQNTTVSWTRPGSTANWLRYFVRESNVFYFRTDSFENAVAPRNKGVGRYCCWTTSQNLPLSLAYILSEKFTVLQSNEDA